MIVSVYQPGHKFAIIAGMVFRALFAAALVLAACTLVEAASPLPELRTQATDGGSIFHVRNPSADQPLTAYLIELVDYPGSGYSLWQDELVTGTPLGPGQERSTRVNNMTVGAAPEYVKLTAALYADGSSAGDAEKVTQFLARRKFLLQTEQELAERLAKAKSAGTAKPEVIASLKSWSESAFPPPTKANRNSQAAINNAAARPLVQEAIAQLDGHSVDDVLASTKAGIGKLSGASAGR